MAGLSFAFNPDEGETPDTLAAKRAIAMALMSHAASSIPHNAGEGLALVGNRLAAALAMSNFENASQGAYKQFGDAMTGLLNSGAASLAPAATPAPAAPGNVPAPSIPSAALSGDSLANTPAPLSGGIPPAPQAATPDYGKAIASIESGGNYGEVGPATHNGDRALGKYQVMASNVPQWTKDALGQPMTPQQFLADPKAQDAVFQHRFGQYVQKYGPVGAAKAWFAGEGGMNNPSASDSLGTTVAGYARKFMNALGPAQANAAEVDPATAQLFSPDASAQPLQPPAGVQVASLDNGVPASEVAADPRQRIAQALTQAPVGRFEDVGGPAPNVTNVPVRPTTLPISDGRAAVAQALAAKTQPPVAPTPTPAPVAGIPPQVADTIRKLSAIPLPQAQTMATQLMQQYMKPHQYSFATLPDGTVIRQDPLSGTVTPIYQTTKPQFVPNASHDQYGNPVGGFVDPTTQTIKLIGTNGQPISPGSPSAPQANADATLTGDAFLKTLDPGQAATVKGIVEGRIPYPTGFIMKTPFGQWLTRAIGQYEPGVDSTIIAQRRKMRTDIAASSPNSLGGILSNGKSAFDHLAELSDRYAALGNYNGPDVPGGGVAATAGNYVGNELLPTANTKDKLKQAADNALKYGQEATKFYAGTGGGEAERMNALHSVNPATATSAEMAGYLETEKSLMLDRMRQKEAQIRDTLGDGYLKEHPVMTPELQAQIKHIDANIAKLRGVAQQPATSGGLPSGWSVQVH